MATVAKIKPAKTPEQGTVNWLDEHIARGVNEPHAEVVTLNPGLATVLLNRNPDNRKITNAKLQHYISSMQRGKWALNGETIIISKDGLLNDGQTRCAAIIEANVCIPATIFFGAERETRMTVDTGGARTAAHFLGMDGLSNAALRGAIARWLLAYEASDGTSVAAINSYSSLENYERAKNDPEIGTAASYIAGRNKSVGRLGPPALFGAAYYIFRSVNETDAKIYLDQLIVGENIKRRDPAYTVRERLLGKVNKFVAFEVVLRGWNAYRQSRTLVSVPTNGELPGLI